LFAGGVKWSTHFLGVQHSKTGSLVRYAWLSVSAALVTMGIKFGAYFLTNSVGLLSDALESLVNLAAALLAGFMLHWASLPPDQDHEFGHEKAEYLSSGVEGALIVVAALGILGSASSRLLHPAPINQLGIGLALSALASAVNAGVAFVLARAGKKHRSVALVADSHHLMSDVYTSGAVVVGVGLVVLTQQPMLDPLVAIAAGIWIGYTGMKILWDAASGLLDRSLPSETLAKIEAILQDYRTQGIDFHALRTRQAGRASFLQIHVLVPGAWTVQKGHQLLEEFEDKLHNLMPGVRLHTHLEPIEDPASFKDIDLDP
jgi:cation diffusion facilitator family transporter